MVRFARGSPNALLRVLGAPILSEHIEQVLHIIGQRGFELHQFIGCRVFEFECSGVECTASDERLLESRFALLQLPGINKFTAIYIVADDRMFDIREMYPYLMGSAGFWV